MLDRSFLRTPVAWLVVLLPLASVIAGVGLVVIAVRSGSNDAVIDTVQRTAQIQVTELGPDERARALRLSAVLRVDGKGKGIELLPVGDGLSGLDRDRALTLVLSHPSEAAQDRTVQLQPSELGWRVATELPLDHDWLLQLAPADGTWRIRGRLHAGQLAAHLGPAVGAE